MKKYNVLIFPAGTEIGLEILNALKFSKQFNVFGATSAADHSKMVYTNLIEGIPFVNDDNFIKSLNEAVKENDIDFIYPAHDSVCLKLTEHKDELGAKVVTSPLETVQICRSKSKTYSFFRGEDFIPKTFLEGEVKNYPVFIKPDVGQGSVGAHKVNSKVELAFRLSVSKDIIICEYLAGEEYTVDCFTDIHRELKVVSARKRNRMKSGISMNSDIVKGDEEIIKIARSINEKLCFNGAWFFQIKKDASGKYKLLEISPRIPGTMGLSRNRGINFPVLTLYNMLSCEVGIINNDYAIEVDRALISRYNISQSYETVYIDLDDTLVLGENVNQFLMMFLYQCVNENKKIVLISRHIKDIDSTLKKHKISKALFNDIIHLSEDEKKSSYIKDANSIFIDDSYRERLEVKKNCWINVFDVDEVEALIDWKKIGWQ